jgi:hypothetical protein
MLTRKQFLRQLLPKTLGAAARLFNPEGYTVPDVRKGDQAFALTELCPSLLIMEAERLGKLSGDNPEESLREQLYIQMKQQAPSTGPET